MREVACVQFHVHDDTLPAALPKGATTIVTVDATTGGVECVSVKIIDWFVTFSGRSERGSFDLDITQDGVAPGGD